MILVNKLFGFLFGADLFKSILTFFWKFMSWDSWLLEIPLFAEVILRLNMLSPWSFNKIEMRSILKAAVLHKKAILRNSSKLLWSLYFGGFFVAGLCLLKIIISFLFSEFFDDAKSGANKEIEESTAVEVEVTDLVIEEQTASDRREAWFLTTVIVAFFVVATLSGMPIGLFNTSLGLGAIITSPSDSVISGGEVPVVEMEIKRFPANVALFFGFIILLKMLQFRSGRIGSEESQTYQGFKPFDPFDSSKTTLFVRVVPEDTVLAAVEKTSDEAYHTYAIHWYDL